MYLGGCLMLRVTPAVEAGIADHVWSIQKIVRLLEPGTGPMKSLDLVVVSTFRSTADAQIAKGILDEAGIESMIRADNAGGMYPAISGAELLVRNEDVQKANESLNRRHRPSK